MSYECVWWFVIVYVWHCWLVFCVLCYVICDLGVVICLLCCIICVVLSLSCAMSVARCVSGFASRDVCV